MRLIKGFDVGIEVGGAVVGAWGYGKLDCCHKFLSWLLVCWRLSRAICGGRQDRLVELGSL